MFQNLYEIFKINLIGSSHQFRVPEECQHQVFHALKNHYKPKIARTFYGGKITKPSRFINPVAQILINL